MSNKSQLDSVIDELRATTKSLEDRRAELDKQIVDILAKKASMDPEEILRGLTNRRNRKSTVKETTKPKTSVKLGSVNSGFYADAITASKPRLRKGDSAANIGSKIYATIQHDVAEQRIRKELSKNFEEEKWEREQQEHKELLDAIKKAQQPKVSKVKETQKTKTEVAKSEPTKPEPAKPELAKNETVATRPKVEIPKNKVASALKVEPEIVSSSRTATSTVVSTATRGAAATTVAKAASGVAVAAVSSIALAKIRKNEEYSAHAYPDPKRDSKGKEIEKHFSIGYGHQITSQEIKRGYIDVSGKKIPVLGELGKDTVISKEDADKLSEFDYKKYEDYAKTLPNFDKLNLKAQAALVDMTYNMGVGWFKNWPGLRVALEKLDLNAASESIINSKYYKDTGKRAQENALIIKNGIDKTKEVPTQAAAGQQILNASNLNSDLKKSNSQTTVIIDNTQTNIIGGSKQTPQVITTPTPSEKPVILGN